MILVVFDLFNYSLFFMFVYLLKFCFFLMRDLKGMDQSRGKVEKNWDELEGGKIIIRMQCMKKEFIFNRRKKMKKYFLVQEQLIFLIKLNISCLFIYCE